MTKATARSYHSIPTHRVRLSIINHIITVLSDSGKCSVLAGNLPTWQPQQRRSCKNSTVVQFVFALAHPALVPKVPGVLYPGSYGAAGRRPESWAGARPWRRRGAPRFQCASTCPSPGGLDVRRCDDPGQAVGADTSVNRARVYTSFATIDVLVALALARSITAAAEGDLLRCTVLCCTRPAPQGWSAGACTCTCGGPPRCRSCPCVVNNMSSVASAAT